MNLSPITLEVSPAEIEVVFLLIVCLSLYASTFSLLHRRLRSFVYYGNISLWFPHNTIARSLPIYVNANVRRREGGDSGEGVSSGGERPRYASGCLFPKQVGCDSSPSPFLSLGMRSVTTKKTLVKRDSPVQLSLVAIFDT
jgi:hypothetical protein